MSQPEENPQDEVMCLCSGTRRSRIRELFLQGFDVEAISRKSGALSGCGGCEWDIAAFVEELAAARDANPRDPEAK